MTRKNSTFLNRTLRWCKDGLVFAANLRHGREAVDELRLSRSETSVVPIHGRLFDAMSE